MVRKKILLLTTVYRVGERIYPIIPYLHEFADITLAKYDQMGHKYNWKGDDDLRDKFHAKYDEYFTDIHDTVSPSDFNCDQYNLIIADDNRARNYIDTVYKLSKKSPMMACSHGNSDKDYHHLNYKTCFDYCATFGTKEGSEDYLLPLGIPANDDLKNYQNETPEHILVIVNFLGNRACPFGTRFDENFIELTGLPELQQKLGQKILVKMKSRRDERGLGRALTYLKKIFPEGVEYEGIMDVENDNELVAKSSVVIGAPSTLAFKPIQLGIPTILIRKSGQHGLFEGSRGLMNLGKEEVLQNIEDQIKVGKDEAFIKETLTGGLEFNSTELFVDKVKEIML